MTGFEPGPPTSIPDEAFEVVTLPSATPAADAAASPTPARTPDDRVLREPAFETVPPERAQPSLRPPAPVVVAVPTPTPKPPPQSGGSGSGGSGGSGDSGGSGGGGSSGTSTTRSISGLASWYCRAGVSPCTYTNPDTAGFDAYAAAGPRLRAALGDWRGRIVYVDGIRVKLIDWCQCYKGEPHEKLLDLYYDVFLRTGSSVTVRW